MVSVCCLLRYQIKAFNQFLDKCVCMLDLWPLHSIDKISNWHSIGGERCDPISRWLFSSSSLPAQKQEDTEGTSSQRRWLQLWVGFFSAFQFYPRLWRLQKVKQSRKMSVMLHQINSLCSSAWFILSHFLIYYLSPHAFWRTAAKFPTSLASNVQVTSVSHPSFL